ncbi:MAG: hypothetical protein AAFV69_00835 [Pseudomonadota bacterium]
MNFKCGIVAIALVTGLAGHATIANAYGNRGDDGLDRGYVLAESRHGNGSVSGRVRPSRLGPQVQLPSGHWEYCRRSCSETLRVETVDFWEGRADGEVGLSQECGVFGCLDIHLGRRGY